MNDSRPVLIVGAGPTGMTAAMELARLGIPVRLVEQCAEPSAASRAIGVHARTLELFRQRGLDEAMLAKGHKCLGSSIYGHGERLYRIDFTRIESRYAWLLFIPQSETENILRTELTRLGVSIEWSRQLVDFTQQDESLDGPAGLTASIRSKDGSEETIAASYLIAAEGAHSRVREILDTPFRGKTLDHHYVLGDFRLEGSLADSDVHIFGSDEGFMGLFPLGRGRFRMIASYPEELTDNPPSLALFQHIYDARSHLPARCHDLSWSSSFRINSRMVDHLGQGRVFLGGDTAHIHSPAGAQGMNTGIQDMINLCWKLAMVLHGQASPDLLQTYDADRLPVIERILKRTGQLTEVVAGDHPVMRSIFEHVAPLFVETNYVQEHSAAMMCQLTICYPDSPLSETHGFHGHMRAGERMPDLDVTLAQDALTETVLLDAMSPDRFSLLLVNGASLDGLEEIINSYSSVLDVLSPTATENSAERFQRALGNKPALVLVRPDGYTAWLGAENQRKKLAAYLAQWLSPLSDGN